MGNFCGLCSCIYPKLDEFDDEEYFATKYAIERTRANNVYSKSPNSIHADVASISSYSSNGTFQTQALAQRRFSLAFDRHSLLISGNDRHAAAAAEIFTIYSPIKFATRPDMMLWPSLSSANSSIVSLNDHKLFMEVADLHMSEIKRQFKQDTAAANMSMFVRRQSLLPHEDSGINMSLNSTDSVTPTKSVKQASPLFTSDMTMTPSLISCKKINPVSQQQSDQDEPTTSTANQRGGQYDDIASSPLVYFFKTINAMTSSLIKTAAYFNTTSLTLGSNYLYKWSAKNSITKLRSKMFKLATFSIAAFVNTTPTNTNSKSSKNLFKSSTKKSSPKASNKITVETQPALTGIFSEELDSTLYGPVSDTYALAKTSPLRQFILRVYDANFF